MKKQWQQYAQIWSLNKGRETELSKYVTPDVVYRDPFSMQEGVDAFSTYMAGFQEQMPGARFEILETFDHNHKTLSHWQLIASDGTVVHDGYSFASLNETGRFQEITGFFAPIGE